MSHGKIVVSLVCALALTMLAACGERPAVVSTANKQILSGATSVATAAATASTSTPSVAATAAKNAATAGAARSDSTAAPARTTPTAVATKSGSGAATAATNAEAQSKAANTLAETTKATRIALNGNTIKVDGKGVTVKGSQAIITAAGTYSISGSLADGQIIVDTKDNEPVRLILNGVTLANTSSAPIYVMEAKEAVIVLADGSENNVSDGKSYIYADPAADEPHAAIFSKADLTISGGGSLTVAGNYNDGIASKDGLTIASGTITVTSVDDGIRGKDYLIVNDGNITVNAGGDGLKSDNAEDVTLGHISIENGVINITAKGDAVTAETDVTIAAGKITLSSGGGYKASLDADTSAKGIKGVASVVIDGGTLAIDSADDAIHSNDSIVINDGTFVMTTGDDGMHADASLRIDGGDIRITSSYEGIESAVITIDGGDIHIVSSDDGLNIAGGTEGAGMRPGPGGRPGRGGGPGQDAFTYTGKQYLYINGGYIAIEAAGDGIDVNGAIAMTDGVVIVNGPIQQMNSALDYDAFFNITGGFLVAAGSSGMAQAPGAASTQNSLLLNYNGTLKAGTLVQIQTSGGKEILTFAPSKQYQSIAFSSPALVRGATYDVYTGGSSTGTTQDGLYQGGTYTPGAKYTSFTVSSVVTTIGGRSR